MSHGLAFVCPFGCNTRKRFKKQSSLNAHMAQCRMRESGVVACPDINKESPVIGSVADDGMLVDDEDDEDMQIGDSASDTSSLEDDSVPGNEPLPHDDGTEDELTVTGLPDRCYEEGFEEYGSFDDHEDDENACQSDLHNVRPVRGGHEEPPGSFTLGCEQTQNPRGVTDLLGVSCRSQFSMEVKRQESTGKIVVYPVCKPKACRIPTDVALLDLARILDKGRCPNYMFDSILSWCKYAGKVGCNPSVDRLPTRKAYFSKLEKRLLSANMTVPGFYTKKVSLETAKIGLGSSSSGSIESEVNYWDFGKQLRSLLSDHSIFGDLSNLNVNDVNPFLPNRDCKSTGGWYQDTIRAKRITGYDGNFLVGIVLAADRTGNTFNLRFGTEPLLFTLTIIKESLWHQPRVWRPLAMIPCDRDCIGQARGNLHSKRNEGMGSSYRNYHAYVRVALESLRMVQSPTYLYWPYNHKGDIPPNAKAMYRGAISNNNVHELCPGVPVKNNVSSHDLKGLLMTLTLGDSQRVMNVVCSVSHVILDGAGADKNTC